MKNHKFNNFSLVLATVLFGFGGVSFVNAAEGYIITGATKNGNTYDGSKGNSGNIVEIDKGDTTGQTPFDEDTSWVNGGNGSNNGKDVVNNTLKVTNVKHDKYPAYRGGYI
ncbi:MAG: hypothetical protein IJT33_04720, partial [Campylobacter sp.]|nr:hypothetical protein [Campylobacter sp.]